MIVCLRKVMKSQNTKITDLFVIIHEPIYININAILRKIKKFKNF
jgi:hypothetical protein